MGSHHTIAVMSNHGIFTPPTPVNEPIKDYAPGSPEREQLKKRIAEMEAERLDIPCIIGGKEVRNGDLAQPDMPPRKSHVLAAVHQAGEAEVQEAIKAAAQAWQDWSRTPWEDRAA